MLTGSYEALGQKVLQGDSCFVRRRLSQIAFRLEFPGSLQELDLDLTRRALDLAF